MPMLIDTNVIGELLRPRPDPRVLVWASGVQAGAVSVVTVEEIAFGFARRPKPRVQHAFESLMAERLSVIGVTEPIARAAGRLRGSFATQGVVRHQADMLIAATALVLGLTVVTRNTRDFTGCGVVVLNPFD